MVHNQSNPSIDVAVPMNLKMIPLIQKYTHDNVIKWKQPLVTGHLCGEITGHRWIPRTKASGAGLWCFFLICAWINGWVNNGKAGDLRHHRAHDDVTVMSSATWSALYQSRYQMWQLICGQHTDYKVRYDFSIINMIDWLFEFNGVSN